MIDSHAHVYSKEFDEDRDATIQRALDAGVSQILLPNIDLESIKPMLATQAKYPNVCRSMMGLHPCYVKEDSHAVLLEMHAWLDKSKLAHTHPDYKEFVAVGEIGIDLYWDKTFLNEQITAFRTQLQWAKEFNLPVVIHTRDSMDETIAVLKEEQDGQLRGVFHCFGGTVDQATAITELGFHVGLGGVTTFKNSNMSNVIPHINIDFIILETDCPYLAPTPNRGKRNEPAYTKLIAQHIADCLQMSLPALDEVTTRNTKQLFNL